MGAFLSKETLINRLTKPRFLYAYPLLAWLFLVAQTTERQMHIGIALAVLGLFLRMWANGYVGHHKVNWTQRQRGDAPIGRLITAGPYAMVRNPLYLGTGLISAGFCVIAGSVLVAVVTLGAFLLIYRRKTAQEEQLLREELGTPYLRYRAVVPRWLPIRRPYADRQGRWSWRGVGASREWKTAIWVSVALGALYLREEILQEHEFWSADGRLKHAVILGSMILLILIDLALELARRRKRAAQIMLACPPGSR